MKILEKSAHVMALAFNPNQTHTEPVRATIMQTLLTFSINTLSVLLIASLFALIFFVGV